ncbi:MAG TPA: hypothetical protein VK137_17880, partial [Planctomycetaceae bacterium]|nr:hypothetical protein [Planctomycetaceae bacterium]
DGWIYACHGFNNISKVAGKDGHVVEMQSGNTFRFRMDGSRIEHFTHGQVNPFGMCFDPLFNIFTADCHTKPITQLLRGGYYQSFGKPDDGLGFVPEIMSHTHGATANCGIVAYYGGHFPKEWEGMFFTGNVMTSRVNVDAPEYHGSTILAKERPDFVISKDPWFRPVDLQCGPDGALYIADFYNKIIGHYEVDLKHPGRDRFRGRIWRVVHKATPPFKMPDLRTVKKPELIELLGHANFKVRSLAFERLHDLTCIDVDGPDGEAAFKVDQELVAMFRQVLASSKNPHARSMAYALLNRSTEYDEHDVIAAAKDSGPEVRAMVMKLDVDLWISFFSEMLDAAIRDRLADDNPFVKRAAAEALGRFNSAANVSALLTALQRSSPEDSHLRQMIRIALRDIFISSPGLLSGIDRIAESQLQVRDSADIAIGMKTPDAARFLISYVAKNRDTGDRLLPMIQHAARYADADGENELVFVVRNRFAQDVLQQLSLLNTLRTALQQRGEAPDASVHDWANELAGKLLESSRGASLSWANEVVPGKPKPDNPWELRARVSQDGDKGSLFFDSLVKGEQLTGLYRSEPFELPAKLSFWCAGHNGLPGAPFNPKNYIRLRDASTHALLREALPPRNDTAQKIEWDLAEFVGQAFQPGPKAPRNAESQKKVEARSGQPGKADLRRGYIELLDADEGNAYAWLAVGRFSVEALNPSRIVDEQIAAANLVVDFKISDLKSQIAERLISRDTDARAKEAFARAALALQPDSILSAVAPLIAEVSLPETLREAVA